MKTSRLAVATFIVAILMAVPAFAEIDLGGNWVAFNHEDWVERLPGGTPVDYMGIPITDEARTRGLMSRASVQSLPERQCIFYPPQYIVMGPQGMKIWAETDSVTGKVVAWKIGGGIDRVPITIWMDGRPHPGKNAPHPFDGFSTGVWEGNTLTFYTTHLKAGFFRRNGIPSSDKATFTGHILRHGETLTIAGQIDDPVYLTTPYFLSRNWRLDPNTQFSPVPPPCVPEVEVPGMEGNGVVPHFLPGKNPFVGELTEQYHIPVEAVLGGEETMYPEFRKKIKNKYVAPEKCVRYCCGGGPAASQRQLDCITGGSATSPR